MWGIHSSHRKKKLQSDNLKTASRRAIFLNWLVTMPLARLLMFLTLFLIDYSILRDDSLYVFSLIFVSHFNLLPFCFSEIKKRGSISVFSSYWRRRVGRLYLILCLFFNFKISRKFLWNAWLSNLNFTENQQQLYLDITIADSLVLSLSLFHFILFIYLYFYFYFCFVSPSSRYALLDTADLPLTIRETTVDYQVKFLTGCTTVLSLANTFNIENVLLAY